MDASTNSGIGETSGADSGEPAILEEIEVEDLAVDGICGVY
jgi:mycofactocin precursor